MSLSHPHDGTLLPGRRCFVAALPALLVVAALPAAAADRRRVRMPDGSVRYMTDDEYRRWRRSAEGRRWDDRNDGRNSGELGDAPRKNDDWRWRRRDGRDVRYPADGG